MTTKVVPIYLQHPVHQEQEEDTNTNPRKLLLKSPYSLQFCNTVDDTPTKGRNTSRAFKLLLVFFHWNTRDISHSRFVGKTRAINVTYIPTEKARRDLNAREFVFLPPQQDISLPLSQNKPSETATFNDTEVFVTEDPPVTP